MWNSLTSWQEYPWYMKVTFLQMHWIISSIEKLYYKITTIWYQVINWISNCIFLSCIYTCISIQFPSFLQIQLPHESPYVFWYTVYMAWKHLRTISTMNCHTHHALAYSVAFHHLGGFDEDSMTCLIVCKKTFFSTMVHLPICTASLG